MQEKHAKYKTDLNTNRSDILTHTKESSKMCKAPDTPLLSAILSILTLVFTGQTAFQRCQVADGQALNNLQKCEKNVFEYQQV